MRSGQIAHKFEIKMDRYVLNSNLQGKDLELNTYIKPLNVDAAFNKGVDYATQIIFFYGVLMGIAYYEVKKNYESSEKNKSIL
jgi:hypothetical protein